MAERVETNDGGSSTSQRRPLHLRMYFESHLTELVRLFGYSEVPVDQAKANLKPLIEKYGEPAIKAAVEEIIIVSDTDPPVARLTDDARRLALQLLGKPSALSTLSEAPQKPDAAPAAGRPQPVDESPIDRPVDSTTGNADPPKKRKRRSRATPADSADVRRPVRLSRENVAGHFVDWLHETRQVFVARAHPMIAARDDPAPGTLDFLVIAKPVIRLVTVRDKLMPMNIRDMHEWARLFCNAFEPYSVWPWESSGEWEWIFTPIPAVPGGKSDRGKTDSDQHQH